MDINQRSKTQTFKTKLLASAVFTSFMFAYANIAGAAKLDPSWVHTKNYLDAGTWSKIVSENSCFSASPKSLLTVEPITVDGQRRYKISQIFDSNSSKQLYATPLNVQIKERKIVAKEFCNGIASISDMKLPFAKTNKTEDANDGMLLVDHTRHGLTEILDQLYFMSNMAMEGASGTFSSTQLSDLNTVFQTHLAEVNRIAEMTEFNGVSLLNGSQSSVDIPIHHGQDRVNIVLPIAKTNILGLDHIAVDTVHGASDAIAMIETATTELTTDLAQLEAKEVPLTSAIKHDATTTLVDVRTDDFTVQLKKYDNLASK